MAEFLFPDVLELPAYQEDVSHCLAAFLTVAHWIQNVRHFSAKEKVPESYLLGPQLRVLPLVSSVTWRNRFTLSRDS
jgi:hypothetical protein